MQQLLVLGIKPYYWSNAKTPAEIDFVVQYNNRVVPVEVKAEENVCARSLAQFVKDNPGLKGLRISMKGYADQARMDGEHPSCSHWRILHSSNLTLNLSPYTLTNNVEKRKTRNKSC